MRNLISNPKNRVTQGSVFCGVRSPYTKKYSYGLCITARCDTARNFKASTMSFLSVVTLEEWIEHEALDKVKEDQRKECEANLSKLLSERIGADKLINTFGIDYVIDYINNSVDAEFLEFKKIKQYNSICEKHLELSRKFVSIEKIPKNLSSKIKSEVKKVYDGNDQEVFFLENVSLQEEHFNGLGYVVLLRSIYSIDRCYALNIPSGFDSSYIERNLLNNIFCDDVENFVYMTGELNSPFIEKLLQSFTMLFSRVGLKNLSFDYVSDNLKKIGESK